MTDTVDVRDIGMICYGRPRPGDFPPEHRDPELTTIARRAFAAGGWDDPDADDDAQFQACLNAFALVPEGDVPPDLLDDVADAMLTSGNMYLWLPRSMAALLRDVDYRGCGEQLAVVLEAHREDDRWDELIDPVREVLGQVRTRR